MNITHHAPATKTSSPRRLSFYRPLYLILATFMILATHFISYAQEVDTTNVFNTNEVDASYNKANDASVGYQKTYNDNIYTATTAERTVYAPTTGYDWEGNAYEVPGWATNPTWAAAQANVDGATSSQYSLLGGTTTIGELTLPASGTSSDETVGTGKINDWSDVGSSQTYLIGVVKERISNKIYAQGYGTGPGGSRIAYFLKKPESTSIDIGLNDYAENSEALFCGHPGNRVVVSWDRGSLLLSEGISAEQASVRKETKTWSWHKVIEVKLFSIKIYLRYKYLRFASKVPDDAEAVLVAHTARRITVWYYKGGQRPNNGKPHRVAWYNAGEGTSFPPVLNVHIEGFWMRRMDEESGDYSVVNPVPEDIIEKYPTRNFASKIQIGINDSSFYGTNPTAGGTLLYYPEGDMLLTPAMNQGAGGPFYKTSPAFLEWDATNR